MKLCLALLMMLATNNAWAQDKTVPAPPRESDKLDIKKLEDKYWAAKDDDFTVVQNRAFPKEHRLYATVLGGIPINDPYSGGTLSGIATGYYFNERWGMELTYLKANFDDNEATEQFVKDHGTVPNHNVLVSQTMLQANWVPLYAKMSFLDKSIIYFDMGIGLGIGQTSFVQKVDGGDRSATGETYVFSLYQHYFLSPHVALKFDYRNTWTMEERQRYKLSPGDTEAQRSLGKKSINDSALLLGLTLFY